MFIDLSKHTPLRGHWLYDAGPDFAPLIFDISNPKAYPRDIGSRFSDRLDLAAYKFRSALRNIIYEKETINGVAVPDNREEIIRKLHNVVSILREEVISNCNLRHVINPQKEVTKFITSVQVKGKLRDLRKHFLYVAKSVVFGYESLESAAAKYGINKTNIMIWISIYLTHGPSCFRYEEDRIPSSAEEVIVQQHFGHRSSIHYTCAHYCIMNQNRFHRMCHRHSAACR